MPDKELPKGAKGGPIPEGNNPDLEQSKTPAKKASRKTPPKKSTSKPAPTDDADTKTAPADLSVEGDDVPNADVVPTPAAEDDQTETTPEETPAPLTDTTDTDGVETEQSSSDKPAEEEMSFEDLIATTLQEQDELKASQLAEQKKLERFRKKEREFKILKLDLDKAAQNKNSALEQSNQDEKVWQQAHDIAISKKELLNNVDYDLLVSLNIIPATTGDSFKTAFKLLGDLNNNQSRSPNDKHAYNSRYERIKQGLKKKNLEIFPKIEALYTPKQAEITNVKAGIETAYVEAIKPLQERMDAMRKEDPEFSIWIDTILAEEATRKEKKEEDIVARFKEHSESVSAVHDEKFNTILRICSDLKLTKDKLLELAVMSNKRDEHGKTIDYLGGVRKRLRSHIVYASGADRIFSPHKFSPFFPPNEFKLATLNPDVWREGQKESSQYNTDINTLLSLFELLKPVEKRNEKNINSRISSKNIELIRQKLKASDTKTMELLREILGIIKQKEFFATLVRSQYIKGQASTGEEPDKLARIFKEFYDAFLERVHIEDYKKQPQALQEPHAFAVSVGIYEHEARGGKTIFNRVGAKPVMVLLERMGNKWKIVKLSETGILGSKDKKLKVGDVASLDLREFPFDLRQAASYYFKQDGRGNFVERLPVGTEK